MVYYGTGRFTVDVGGLADGVTYYARVYAVNELRVVYGNQMLVTPSKIKSPEVAALEATEVTATTAKVSLNISSADNPPYQRFGIAYGTKDPASDPSFTGIQRTEQWRGSLGATGTGTYDWTFDNETLQPSTVYYAQAYVVTANGEYIFGNTVCFTTLEPTLPVHETV